MKKLYRSRENVIISGILGGIAEYLEIDPVVVRVVFILLTCITGFFPGIVFYAVCLFIVPRDISTINQVNQEPTHHDSSEKSNPTKNDTDIEQTISEDFK